VDASRRWAEDLWRVVAGGRTKQWTKLRYVSGGSWEGYPWDRGSKIFSNGLDLGNGEHYPSADCSKMIEDTSPCPSTIAGIGQAGRSERMQTLLGGKRPVVNFNALRLDIPSR
jgi:hypothetical protein